MRLIWRFQAKQSVPAIPTQELVRRHRLFSRELQNFNAQISIDGCDRELTPQTRQTGAGRFRCTKRFNHFAVEQHTWNDRLGMNRSCCRGDRSRTMDDQTHRLSIGEQKVGEDSRPGLKASNLTIDP